MHAVIIEAYVAGVSTRSVDELVAALGAQPDPEAVVDAWDRVADQLTCSFPKVGPLMADTKDEVLAFCALPKAHWQKIWSTNPLERINKEIKRRSRVIGIFPNESSAIRLVGAISDRK